MNVIIVVLHIRTAVDDDGAAEAWDALLKLHDLLALLKQPEEPGAGGTGGPARYSAVSSSSLFSKTKLLKID